MSAGNDSGSHVVETAALGVTYAAPVALHQTPGGTEIEFAYTEDGPGGLQHLAETFRLRADQVLSAIGQRLVVMPDGLIVAGGKIAVTGPGRSALPGARKSGQAKASTMGQTGSGKVRPNRRSGMANRMVAAAAISAG